MENKIKTIAERLAEIKGDIQILCKLRQNDKNSQNQKLYNTALTQLYDEKFNLIGWLVKGECYGIC